MNGYELYLLGIGDRCGAGPSPTPKPVFPVLSKIPRGILGQNEHFDLIVLGRVDVLRPKSHPHIDLRHYKRIPAVRSANHYMTWPYGLIRQHGLV